LEILNFNEWFVQLHEFDAPKQRRVRSILNREKKPIRTFKIQAVLSRAACCKTDEQTLSQLLSGKFSALG